MRVTRPLLDVAEVLLEAFEADAPPLHGWAIMKATARSGPTVYGVLDRMEDAHWIVGRWEELPPDHNRPRRRFYELTPNGVGEVRTLLAGRRRHAARRDAPGLAWARQLRHVVFGGGL